MAEPGNDREALAARFEGHAAEEGRILAQYRVVADKLGESPARFLIRLIMMEEELHHQLLHAAARWLRAPAGGGEGANARGENTDELLQLTRELQAHEMDTVTACRSLEIELAGAGGEVLRSVLDVMALDSEKHHRLLASVQRIVTG
jgi:hypothetical protein